MTTRLAIVLPAHKPDFLALTLESIAAQTDRRFRVYVGDDASPADLRAICEPFARHLDLHYVRFGENLGATALTSQWDRCVRLAGEPWVWLFSDDDLMDARCVEALHDSLERTGGRFDLYHFDTAIVDRNGQVRMRCHPFDEVESVRAFALGRLQYRKASFAPGYVFSRAAFEREGGFVSFPAGWGSDDASCIAFAGEGGIYTIKGPLVYWRASGLNISAFHSPFRKEKARACLQYLAWLDARLERVPAGGPGESREALRRHYAPWFYRQLLELSPWLGPLELVAMAKRWSAIAGIPLGRSLCRFARTNLRTAVAECRARLSGSRS